MSSDENYRIGPVFPVVAYFLRMLPTEEEERERLWDLYAVSPQLLGLEPMTEAGEENFDRTRNWRGSRT